MRWKAEDLEKLIEMEQYIDTLLYPVCVSPASWDREWIASQLWVEKVCTAAEQPLSPPRRGDYLKSTVPDIIQNLEAIQAHIPILAPRDK